ncbi:hypothetical protein C8R43DRAFT_1230302, partial [Mycena crocata]
MDSVSVFLFPALGVESNPSVGLRRRLTGAKVSRSRAGMSVHRALLWFRRTPGGPLGERVHLTRNQKQSSWGEACSRLIQLQKNLRSRSLARGKDSMVSSNCGSQSEIIMV